MDCKRCRFIAIICSRSGCSDWRCGRFEQTLVTASLNMYRIQAHAMTPFQGSGAGQAIEVSSSVIQSKDMILIILKDGYILATVLARITPTSDNSESIIRALKVYNTIRRPASQNVQRLSRANGLTYELNDDECQNISVQDSAAGMVPMELLAGINKKIEENFGWTWRTSIARDRDEAIRHMDEES